MTMSNKGLSKLIEECGELSKELGELVQVAAKKLACMSTDEHWDGMGSLKERLENEIADVRAAAAFVVYKLGLDTARIKARSSDKIALFLKWDKGDKT